MRSTSKWGGERIYGDKITYKRREQGTEADISNYNSLHTSDIRSLSGSRPHGRTVTWHAGCVAQGKSASCLGILSVTLPLPNSPQRTSNLLHRLSSYHSRCPWVGKDFINQRGQHPGSLAGEFDLSTSWTSRICSVTV